MHAAPRCSTTANKPSLSDHHGNSSSSYGSYEQAMGYPMTQLWDDHYADSGIASSLHSQGDHVFSPSFSDLEPSQQRERDLFNNNLEGLDNPLLLQKFLAQLQISGGLMASANKAELNNHSMTGSGDPTHPLPHSHFHQQQHMNNGNGTSNNANNNMADFASAGLTHFATADILSALSASSLLSKSSSGMPSQMFARSMSPSASSCKPAQQPEQQYLMSTPQSQTAGLSYSSAELFQHVSPIPSQGSSGANLHGSSSSQFQTIDALLKQEKSFQVRLSVVLSIL